ncbi:sugar 3,4-ketoisomerase [Pontibacter oryzae]|uniref:WxcM-like domain-containing protein n=1 Tax=Pontibacter oryzae TaxID=2304593 RepID=A0A399S3C4_9BACT|nr:FdtA/QdtA family cupin domain-containing protein [Pontibacter oryzae]RIJ37023.1 WxcM-like domain-containing protein [Pontibacter oryzae]
MPATPYLLSFDCVGSPSIGFITSTQHAAHIPFEIKRVFWTQATPPGVERGHHANLATEEVLVALNGSIHVRTDTGHEQQEFILSSPQQGLYIPAMCWTELRFSEGATALCLTSTDFSEEDYLRDYAYFLKLATHSSL